MAKTVLEKPTPTNPDSWQKALLTRAKHDRSSKELVEPRGQNSNPTALSALHVSTGANAIGHDNRRAGRSGSNKEMVGPEGLEPPTKRL